jgi:hypothetical protein
MRLFVLSPNSTSQKEHWFIGAKKIKNLGLAKPSKTLKKS